MTIDLYSLKLLIKVLFFVDLCYLQMFLLRIYYHKSVWWIQHSALRTCFKLDHNLKTKQTDAIGHQSHKNTHSNSSVYQKRLKFGQQSQLYVALLVNKSSNPCKNAWIYYFSLCFLKISVRYGIHKFTRIGRFIYEQCHVQTCKL